MDICITMTMTKHITAMFLTLGLQLALVLPARAESALAPTLGISTDVLPPIMSGIAGDIGGTLAVGYGTDRFQVRALGFRTSVPSAIIGNDAFDRLSATGAAVIADVFRSRSRRGLWLGVGLERWTNTTRHAATGRETTWTTWAPTASAGYLWSWASGFYVTPHLGFTVALDPATVNVNGDTLEQPPFLPELSVKLGWNFTL